MLRASQPRPTEAGLADRHARFLLALAIPFDAQEQMYGGKLAERQEANETPLRLAHGIYHPDRIELETRSEWLQTHL